MASDEQPMLLNPRQISRKQKSQVGDEARLTRPERNTAELRSPPTSSAREESQRPLEAYPDSQPADPECTLSVNRSSEV